MQSPALWCWRWYLYTDIWWLAGRQRNIRNLLLIDTGEHLSGTLSALWKRVSVRWMFPVAKSVRYSDGWSPAFVKRHEKRRKQSAINHLTVELVTCTQLKTLHIFIDRGEKCRLSNGHEYYTLQSVTSAENQTNSSFRAEPSFDQRTAFAHMSPAVVNVKFTGRKQNLFPGTNPLWDKDAKIWFTESLG